MKDKISKILFQEDLIGLRSPSEGEYDNEANLFEKWYDGNEENILPLLYNIFVYQFNWGTDCDGNLSYHNIVGEIDRFKSCAEKIKKVIRDNL